jgi:AcrR family transcriptional regulator
MSKEAQVMAPRRIGASTSKTRSILLNAAEALMRESGYAAVTSRRLAARAGLKPQLVHYYFRTMDDLFLALFRRVAVGFAQRQSAILKSKEPLKALWDLTSDPKGVVLSYEFVALANHRKAIRAEIAEVGDRLREKQAKILAHCLGDGANGRDTAMGAGRWPPVFSAVLLDSLARTLALESALGVSAGHGAARATIGRFIRQVDRSLRTKSKRATSQKWTGPQKRVAPQKRAAGK